MALQRRFSLRQESRVRTTRRRAPTALQQRSRRASSRARQGAKSASAMDDDDAPQAAVYPDEILHAICRHEFDIVRQWLQEGKRDVNHPIDSQYSYYSNELHHRDSLLTFLVRRAPGDRDGTDMVKMLVAHGADVRRINTDGWTALHACRYTEHAAVLLESGAELDAQTHARKITPLMMAARDHREQLVRFLLRSGADLSLETECPGMDCTGFDAEWFCDFFVRDTYPCTDLLRAIKSAGGWKPYARAPRVELVRLRGLCARGRARPPIARRDPILARLFSAAPSSSSTPKRLQLHRPIPNEVFWHILQFWRSIRDD